jgi:hypothetical protein
MVCARKREKPAAPEKMSVENLVETLKGGCVIQGERGYRWLSEEAKKAQREIIRRGVQPKTVENFMKRHRSVGSAKVRPMRRGQFPGELAFNDQMIHARHAAERSESALYQKLAKLAEPQRYKRA